MNVTTPIYKQFLEYLHEGSVQVIQSYRDGLEDHLVNSIDINKSRDIIDKYKKKGDNFVVSPEIFLAVGLVDNLPPHADLRFVPEFRLDCVIFKNRKRGGTKDIKTTKVPYSEKTQKVLKFQIIPDSESEMNKSLKYLNNLIYNLELFNEIYRSEIINRMNVNITRIRDIVSKPSIPLTNAILCLVNSNGYKHKVPRSAAFLIKNQKMFSQPFNQKLEKLKLSGEEPNQKNVDRIVYAVILNKIFPRLLEMDIQKICDISTDMTTPVSYEEIRTIIVASAKDQQIAPSFCTYLNTIRSKGKNWIKEEKENLIKKNETLIQEIEILINEKGFLISKEKRKHLIRQKSVLMTKNKNLIKEKNLIDKESFIAEFSDFIPTDEQGKELLLAQNNIKELMRNSDMISINHHNFFNLIMFINKCRYLASINQINKVRMINKKKVINTISVNPIVYTEIIDYCSTQSALINFIESYTVEKNRTKMKDLRSWFNNYLYEMPFWDKIKDRINLEDPTDILNERFTNAIYPTRLKVKKNEKYVDSKEEIFSEKYIRMKKDIDRVSEFYDNKKAWDTCTESSLYEITTGTVLSNVKDIGVANVLNFLFKDQVDDNYFQNVQHILFHDNTIVVSKGGVLSSLAPSDGYKQFVLKNFDGLDEEMVMMDHGDVQLHRFQNILNDVVRNKTKELFSTQTGDTYLDVLEDITQVEFIDTIEQHKISIGSINKHEQEAFTKFLKDFPFIFPAKISQIHLSKFDKQGEIPIDPKELFFYIEKRKNDRDMDVKYFITQEDIILLGRSAFYLTILIERAFCVIFNKEILNNDLCFDFKSAVGKRELDIAKKHFAIRGQSITEDRILRKIFVQNGLLYLQGKKEQLSAGVMFFMNSIFNQNKQLN